MRLPTYGEIARDEQQLAIYETPFDQSVFAVGPPGSGKTVLAVHRAQMLVEAGVPAVLITYNRMLRRLIAQLTEQRLPAQTMHGFVYRKYPAQVQTDVPERRRYDPDWNAMFEVLKHRGVTPARTHVIVDEGQDLPADFFRYLRSFVATSITVFADEDQALTAERSTLSDIKKAARFEDDPVLLHANHRNTPEIASFAERFHAGVVPVADVQRPSSGERPRVVAWRRDDAAARIANWYTTRGGRVGVAVVNNSTGASLYAGLRDRLPGQAVGFYSNQENNEDEIDLLESGVTILNVQSIKGQEFDTVFFPEFDKLLDAQHREEQRKVNQRKMYMVCTRARDHLILVYEGDRLPPALLDKLPGADMKEQEPTLWDLPNAGVPSATDEAPPGWLGLVTNHRRLFDAGQDGWMRPLTRSGFLLGPESFVSEDVGAGRNVIPVRLRLDAGRLPFPDAREGLARGTSGSVGDERPLVHWRAPLPLYAVQQVEVPSPEQRSQLLAMAGRFANVSLPAPDVAVSDFVPTRPAGDQPVSSKEPGVVELPDKLNAVQGAMAMAVWAAPRQAPWIEVLHRALEQDAARSAQGIEGLGAGWLQLPWLVGGSAGAAAEGGGDQARLWRGALSRMQWSRDAARSPGVLAEEIAEAASGEGAKRAADGWLDQTRRIVAAEETITCNGWKRDGAGLAIRLALLRPEPLTFKSWIRDLPGLPPAVWWAAAVLCGWRHGYRALDKAFRGDARLQELLATRALAASWPGGAAEVLPPSQQSPLERTHEDGCFALTWRGDAVVRKPWGARARWSNADMTDVTADRGARDVAARLGWSCLERRLLLPEGRVPVLGNGNLAVDDGALVVRGETVLRLPQGAELDERFDPDEFRRQLATEAGEVPDPPPPASGVARDASGPPPAPSGVFGAAVRPAPALIAGLTPALGGTADRPEASRPEQVREVPGLIYQPNFITEEEEGEIVVQIDDPARAEWSTELQRRVQHYGWRYDYTQRQVDESMRLGELPEWARKLARRLVDEGLVKDLPDQVIVNEYRGDQGISRHVDQPRDFAEHVATISLLETWGMLFRRSGSKDKFEKPLERRSVAVLTGDARYGWTHEIPKRKSESRTDRHGRRVREKRERRISLTFRKTLRHDRRG